MPPTMVSPRPQHKPQARGRGGPGVSWGADGRPEKKTNLADVMRQQRQALARVREQELTGELPGRSSLGAAIDELGRGTAARASVHAGSSPRLSVFGVDDSMGGGIDLSLFSGQSRNRRKSAAKRMSVKPRLSDKEVEDALEEVEELMGDCYKRPRSRSEALALMEAARDAGDCLANPAGDLTAILEAASERLQSKFGAELADPWYDPPAEERVEKFDICLNLLRHISDNLEKALPLSKRAERTADVIKAKTEEAEAKAGSNNQRVEELEQQVVDLTAQVAHAQQLHDAARESHETELARIRRLQEEERAFWKAKVEREREQGVLDARREMRVAFEDAQGAGSPEAQAMRAAALEGELDQALIVLEQKTALVSNLEREVLEHKETIGTLMVNLKDMQAVAGDASTAVKIARLENQLLKKAEECAHQAAKADEAHLAAEQARSAAEATSEKLEHANRELSKAQSRIAYIMRHEGRKAEAETPGTDTREDLQQLQEKLQEAQQQGAQQAEELAELRPRCQQLELRVAELETAALRSPRPSPTSAPSSPKQKRGRGLSAVQQPPALSAEALAAERRKIRAELIAEQQQKKLASRTMQHCMAHMRGDGSLAVRFWWRLYRWGVGRRHEKEVEAQRNTICELRAKYDELLRRCQTEGLPAQKAPVPQVTADPSIEPGLDHMLSQLSSMRAELLLRLRPTQLPLLAVPPPGDREPTRAAVLLGAGNKWVEVAIAILRIDARMSAAQAHLSYQAVILGTKLKRAKRTVARCRHDDVRSWWERQAKQLKAHYDRVCAMREELRKMRKQLAERCMLAGGKLEMVTAALGKAAASVENTETLHVKLKTERRREEVAAAMQLAGLEARHKARQEAAEREATKKASKPVPAPRPQGLGPLAPRVSPLAPSLCLRLLTAAGAAAVRAVAGALAAAEQRAAQARADQRAPSPPLAKSRVPQCPALPQRAVTPAGLNVAPAAGTQPLQQSPPSPIGAVQPPSMPASFGSHFEGSGSSGILAALPAGPWGGSAPRYPPRRPAGRCGNRAAAHPRTARSGRPRRSGLRRRGAGCGAGGVGAAPARPGEQPTGPGVEPHAPARWGAGHDAGGAVGEALAPRQGRRPGRRRGRGGRGRGVHTLPRAPQAPGPAAGQHHAPARRRRGHRRPRFPPGNRG
eukprot:TRINITY_DN6796_c0_g1_i2.p1 TRINITY_DN6796_c0_g1~~TRINITY_DN6796_c0_g1_i2.p1  ORF type:complete len:1185 (+),score=310.34 TRINITY_DN6796_c0_g1_i2:80-3556(+)